MILPDVNVLVYAIRPDTTHHAISRRWLQRAVDGEARFALSRLTLSSMVRIVTNHRIFRVPATLDEAFAFCDALSTSANCVTVEPGRQHWQIFERLCRETDTRGSRVTDAWLAALAIEHGCEWVTFDRDFARFPDLKWSVPR